MMQMVMMAMLVMVIIFRRPLPTAGGARQRSNYTQQVLTQQVSKSRRKSKDV